MGNRKAQPRTVSFFTNAYCLQRGGSSSWFSKLRLATLTDFFRWGLLLIGLVAGGNVARADSTSLLAQTQAANASRYQFALDKKAEILNTSDNKAFTLWWQGSSSPNAVIVSLHGHGSYATDEFYLWQPYAEKRNYAILALQWWFGGGEATSDYYQPNEMYPIIASVLQSKGVKPGAVLFHGFSRGSANSYAVAALDVASGNRYFTTTLSNAGGAMTNYPPNMEIDKGVFGSKPFAGMQWIMYCGEKDPDPQMSGCPAMLQSKEWVSKYGATISLFMDDVQGDHGGFMTNSSNVEAALAAFTPNNRYADADKIFDWAESKYPSSFPGHVTSTLGGGYYYRCYSNQSLCMGAKNDDYYLYQNGKISKVGTLTDLLLQASK